jgi:Leucine-rich repeat (LRR) protein
MKKILFLLMMPVLCFGQNVNIPDANFKAYLVSNSSINSNGDGEIQVSEAMAYSGKIECDSLSISDLTGLEAFSALNELYCNDNQLTTLDVSKNTALTILLCHRNKLAFLDISNNANLEFLSCGNNQLTSIDLRNNKLLYFLSCQKNKLTSLDVSQNINLMTMSCEGNKLTSLDVSMITSLDFLSCKGQDESFKCVKHVGGPLYNTWLFKVFDQTT